MNKDLLFDRLLPSLFKLLERSTPLAEGMKHAFKLCRKYPQFPNWKELDDLEGLDFEKGQREFNQWLEDTFVEFPKKLRAIFFMPCVTCSRDGSDQMQDLRIFGFSKFDPVDHSWRSYDYACKSSWEDTYADLEFFRELTAQDSSYERRQAEEMIFLAFVTLALNDICRTRKLLLGRARNRAIVMGWSGGDDYRVGQWVEGKWIPGGGFGM